LPDRARCSARGQGLMTGNMRARLAHPALLTLVAAVVWMVARHFQTEKLGWGTGFDVGLYQNYAQSWGAGHAPYSDFQPEYPPAAMLVFIVPYLWNGGANYQHAFALWMACFDLASCLLVLHTVCQIRPPRSFLPLFAALLYIAGTAALYPVLYTRF